MAGTPEQHLRAVFEHCTAKTGAEAGIRRGQLVVRVHGRTFAFLRAYDVTVRPGRALRASLLRRPGVRPAKYLRWLGWVTIALDEPEMVSLAWEATDASYELASAQAAVRR